MMSNVAKRGPGRPRAEVSRVEDTPQRPTRIPVSGHRDILTVRGKDPDYVYRHVKDVDESGQRIMRFLEAGWTFTDPSTVKIGQNFVYKTESTGSVVRVPAGQGEFLYLMQIRKEWYDEDQIAKQQNIINIEQDLTKNIGRDGNSEGVYGSVKIGQQEK